MAKTKNEKRQTVQDLVKKLQAAKSVVFADYNGLTVVQLTELRQKLKKSEAELAVTKNTLLKRALTTINRQIDEQILAGPTATIFGFGDQISPIKILAIFAKNFGLPVTKAGFLDSQPISKDEVEQLANLPEQNQLQAQVVAYIASPLSGLVNVLQANIGNLINTLDQTAKKN